MVLGNFLMLGEGALFEPENQRYGRRAVLNEIVHPSSPTDFAANPDVGTEPRAATTLDNSNICKDDRVHSYVEEEEDGVAANYNDDFQDNRDSGDINANNNADRFGGIGIGGSGNGLTTSTTTLPLPPPPLRSQSTDGRGSHPYHRHSGRATTTPLSLSPRPNALRHGDRSHTTTGHDLAEDQFSLRADRQ